MPEDDPALRDLLGTVGLPVVDVATGRQEYILALDGEVLVGSIGVELVGQDALVRSLAVASGWRGRGIANELHDRATTLARLRGIKTLYLLTTTVEGFAAKRGFERIARAEVPPGVAALAQFRALCPVTAVCMRRRIAPEQAQAETR